MLDIAGLSFEYRDSGALFRDLDLQIEKPGFYSFFGRSGSGKSTLGRIISAQQTGHHARQFMIPDPALYASDEDDLPSWIPVERHLGSVVSKRHSGLLNEFLAVARIDPSLLKRRPDDLSQGQRQRLNIARYLFQDSQVLIFDEVLSNVDQPTRWAILNFMRTVAEKKYIIYISHEIDDVLKFSDSVFLLRSTQPTTVEAIGPVRTRVGDLDMDRYLAAKSTMAGL